MPTYPLHNPITYVTDLLFEASASRAAATAMEEGEEAQLLVVGSEESARARSWPVSRCLASCAVLLVGALWLSLRPRWNPGYAPAETASTLALYASSAQCLKCGEVLQCRYHFQQSNWSQDRDQDEQGTFMCSDGCVINQSQLNDDACHCPRCEDETEWSCETCGGQVLRTLGEDEHDHYFEHHDDHYARDVGLGVGISLSSAFALGFGLAFGLDTSDSARSLALAATYYLVVVHLRLRVFAALPFQRSRVLQRIFCRAMARLAGVSFSEVALRFPASGDDGDDDGDGDGDDDDGRRLMGLRRLQEAVGVDVGIRFQDPARAAQVNQQLGRETQESVQPIVSSELQSAGNKDRVEVVEWTPAPNPASYSPNKGPVDSAFQFEDGVSLG